MPATFIWAGTEDIYFQNATLPQVITTPGYFRGGTPGFSRCCLSQPSGGGNGLKGNHIPVSGVGITSCWFSCYNRFVQVPVASVRGPGLGDFVFNGGVFVGTGPDSPYQVAFYAYDSGITTLLHKESGTSFTSALQKIDVEIIGPMHTATVNIYIDLVLVDSFTADLGISGLAGFDCAVVGPSPQWGISEFVICDLDTRNFDVFSQYGIANGDTDQWTGTYSDYNEVQINDVSAVFTNTPAQDEQALGASLPVGAFSIIGCNEVVRFTKAVGSSVGTLKLGVKTNSAINVDGGHSATTAWAQAERAMILNPVTGIAWTPAEINALQIDIQSAT